MVKNNQKLLIINRFLTFFAKSLNPDITSRIWDIYLFEGIITLFKAGISYLFLYINIK